jgi:hypothetical protein
MLTVTFEVRFGTSRFSQCFCTASCRRAEDMLRKSRFVPEEPLGGRSDLHTGPSTDRRERQSIEPSAIHGEAVRHVLQRPAMLRCATPLRCPCRSLERNHRVAWGYERLGDTAVVVL